jgi:phosphonate transport system substrate-binding protein
MFGPSPLRQALASTSLLLLPLLAACGNSAAQSERVLYFSAIPDSNKSDLAAKYGRLATYLSSELGVQVEYAPATSYGSSVEAFKNGDIQLAWFGGVTGVQARRAVEGARAIAQGRIDPRYYSYFIAHKDSGVEPGDDFPTGLAGKTFLFGSPDSTSGRVMPEFYIRENTGQSPEQFFGHPNRFSGGHDLTALAVQEGTADAGALSYKKYDSMVAAGVIDPKVCRIVWRTPEYPDYNWTAHPMLEDRFGLGFTDRLQAALVAITDPELLAGLLRPEGLIPAKNADFEAIETTMLQIGMAR